MKPIYSFAALASASAAALLLSKIDPDASTVTIYIQVMSALALGYVALASIAKGLK